MPTLSRTIHMTRRKEGMQGNVAQSCAPGLLAQNPAGRAAGLALPGLSCYAWRRDSRNRIASPFVSGEVGRKLRLAPPRAPAGQKRARPAELRGRIITVNSAGRVSRIAGRGLPAKEGERR